MIKNKRGLSGWIWFLIILILILIAVVIYISVSGPALPPPASAIIPSGIPTPPALPSG